VVNFTSPLFYPWERAPVRIESVYRNISDIHRREKQQANFMSASLYFFTQALLFLHCVNEKKNFCFLLFRTVFSAGPRCMFYVIFKTASKLMFSVCKCRGNDRANAPDLISCAYISRLQNSFHQQMHPLLNT
jgi:hypothetical protein